MPSGLPSISYASSIVGFTSFAFTFFTFLKVFWETILTLLSAPKQMKSHLDNLRSELQGERAYLRGILRRSRSKSRGRRDQPHDNVAVIRLLNDSVKELMHDLKKIEKPFLNEPPDEKEKDVERSGESIRGDYARVTLYRRWRWMRCKGDVFAMAEEVSRIQTRRIAHETSTALLKIHGVERIVQDIEDRLGVLEEHLLSATVVERRR